jgi:hypothetical protein
MSPPLILSRASTSASSGQWGPDDFDVLEDGAVVGRIFKVPNAPPEKPWMWASGHNRQIRRAAHGYAETREAAMAAFAKSWRQELGMIAPLRIADAARQTLED